MVKWLQILTLAFFVMASPTVASAFGHAVAVMYHRFGEDSYPSTNTTLAQFDSQIRHLKENGFTREEK